MPFLTGLKEFATWREQPCRVKKECSLSAPPRRSYAGGCFSPSTLVYQPRYQRTSRSRPYYLFCTLPANPMHACRTVQGQSMHSRRCKRGPSRRRSGAGADIAGGYRNQFPHTADTTRVDQHKPLYLLPRHLTKVRLVVYAAVTSVHKVGVSESWPARLSVVSPIPVHIRLLAFQPSIPLPATKPKQYKSIPGPLQNALSGHRVCAMTRPCLFSFCEVYEVPCCSW